MGNIAIAHVDIHVSAPRVTSDPIRPPIGTVGFDSAGNGRGVLAHANQFRFGGQAHTPGITKISGGIPPIPRFSRRARHRCYPAIIIRPAGATAALLTEAATVSAGTTAALINRFADAAPLKDGERYRRHTAVGTSLIRGAHRRICICAGIILIARRRRAAGGAVIRPHDTRTISAGRSRDIGRVTMRTAATHYRRIGNGIYRRRYRRPCRGYATRSHYPRLRIIRLGAAKSWRNEAVGRRPA